MVHCSVLSAVSQDLILNSASLTAVSTMICNFCILNLLLDQQLTSLPDQIGTVFVVIALSSLSEAGEVLSYFLFSSLLGRSVLTLSVQGYLNI